MNFKLPILTALALLTFVWSDAGHAGAPVQATAWSELSHSRARLVRGAARSEGAYEVGVQIQLDPGWKTYWRVPGDSGVPPEFDWSRSVNIGSVDVLWPTPERFRDEYGDNIGYHDEVVFPLVVTPGDGASPARLDMTVYFAVCDDICIPAKVELDLELTELNASPRYAWLLSQYLSQVPRPPGEVPGLRVAAVASVEGSDGLKLVVDVLCEDPERDMAIFAEGPDALFFGVPQELTGAPRNHKRFEISVSGSNAADVLQGAGLRFVVVDGAKRLAQDWRLP